MYAKRREALRKKLHEQNLAAMLVSYPPNRFYLSGFELHDVQQNESAGHLLVMADGHDVICTDPRYLETARRIWNADGIFIYGGSGSATRDLNGFLRSQVRGTLGFEAGAVSLKFYNAIAEGLDMRQADGLVETMREIKDAQEIACLEESMALNHKLMEWIPSMLLPGRTEADIAWDIEKFFRENGASENAFRPIVAVGPNAALPHAEPGQTLITDNCPVLIDCGARYMTYNSDQTRTFWVGDAPADEFRRAMDLVRGAQSAAIALIRPGVKCCDVYRAAYDHFDKAGQAEYFTHGLGHGVGLETHEAPSFRRKGETVLQPGMVITVEPGLYYPQWGGVRWENVVLVTEDGVRVL